MSRITQVLVALFAGLILSTGTAVAQVPRYHPKPLPPRPDQVRPQFPTDRGAWITYVQPGGPADRAGLELGDIILSVNGRRIISREHLQDALSRSWGHAELEVINCRDYSRAFVTVLATGNDLGILFTIRDVSPGPWRPTPGPTPWPHPWPPAPWPYPWPPVPGVPGSSGMVSPAG
jgi:hypothetical protein